MPKINFTELNGLNKLEKEDYQLTQDGQQWKILLSRGECNTGGYDIEVEEVTCQAGVLRVVVSLEDPDPDAFVTMMITYPTREYALELNQEFKKVVFQDKHGDILKVIHI